MNILQLHIVVTKSDPVISRTILISDQSTFSDLHDYIQQMFGFSNTFDWFFSYKNSARKLNVQIGGENFYHFPLVAPATFESEPNHESTILKSIFIDESVKKMTYEYEDWNLKVHLETVISSAGNEKLPQLKDASGNMLLEGCGGIEEQQYLLDNCKERKTNPNWFDEYFDGHSEYLNECENLENFEAYVGSAEKTMDWKGFSFSSPQKQNIPSPSRTVDFLRKHYISK